MNSNIDWKKLVAGVAPVLGTALLGPLGGQAVSMLGAALGLGPSASETDVAAMVTSGRLSDEQIVAMRTADQAFQTRMKELDIDIIKLNQEADRAYIADTSDARHAFGGNENVFVLGVCILITFGVLMASVLVGCFLMMTGYFKVDPNIMAVCAGLIGTVVGYVAANAQQVVSYFYGSSKGSKDSGNAIGAALTESIKQQATTTEALAAKS
jgi:hypothetical protein